MGESGYAISSWSPSAGYSASMLTEDAKVDSSSTRQLIPSSVNISAGYPALPDHDSMNNPSKFIGRKYLLHSKSDNGGREVSFEIITTRYFAA